MKNKAVKDKILACIEQYSIMLSIVDCYFAIDEIEIERESDGKIEFSLGPSFRYKDEWTIQKLDEVKTQFYKDIQNILIQTDFDFVIISTKYNSWRVSGYDIKMGYKL